MKKTPIHMTPIERRLGRLMRAPDHPLEGGAENNGAGNEGGAAGAESGSPNNTGPEAQLEGFWNSEDESGNDGPAGESSGTQPGSSSTGTQGNQGFVQQLQEQITNANFGNLITAEIQDAMANGDSKPFNEALNGYAQQVMRQTIAHSISIMRELRGQMTAEFEQMLDGRITTDKNFDALYQEIPSAQNPLAGPTIKNIYTQALTRAKGDTKAAIQMTKDVLKLQAENFGGDLGLNVAPRDSGDRQYAQPKPTNWLEELSVRN